MPQNRRNKSGRPARGAFRGPIVETPEGQVYETSVYCKRLLRGRPIPDTGAGDLIAEFPVAWVLDPAITRFPLHIVPDSNDPTHFLIRGKDFDPEFLDYLREYSVIRSPEE